MNERYCYCGNLLTYQKNYCSVKCRVNSVETREKSRNRMISQNADPRYVELRNTGVRKFLKEMESNASFVKARNDGLIRIAREYKDFKKTHDGRSPTEELFYNNKRVQEELNPEWNRIVLNGKRYYQLDFVVFNKIDVEIDCNWIGHKDDSERDTYLESIGYRVMRFNNIKVINNIDEVIDSIRSNL